FGWPLASHAFPTTDQLIFVDSGRYPAYPPPPPDGHVVHFYVDGGMYHDSNLFRFSDSFATPPGVSKADTVVRGSLGLHVDEPLSRQHLVLDANIDRYHYDNNNFLNYTGGALKGQWNWQVGNDWNGELGASAARYLGGFGEFQAPIKDMIIETHA